MLTITETAVDFLSRARDDSNVPAGATLRIGVPSTGEVDGVTLGFVEQPFSGDEIGEAHGLPVCVAPEVADALDSAVLDVVHDDVGTRLVLVPES